MLEIQKDKIEEENKLSSGERLVVLKDKSCRALVEKWLGNGVDLHLCSVVGIDNEDAIQVLYYFMDRKDNTTVAVAVNLDHEKPVTDTIGDLIGSSVYEGEATEMFGIEFTGNEIARVFLPENWVGGYPLRKSWKKEDYFDE